MKTGPTTEMRKDVHSAPHVSLYHQQHGSGKNCMAAHMASRST